MTRILMLAMCTLFANAVSALAIEPVKLFPTIPSSTPTSVNITGDSRFAVVTANLAGDGGRELYSSRVGGGGPLIRLSQFVAADRRGVEGVFPAPLGDLIVFVLDATALGQRELFAVKADGSSTPVKLAGPTAPGGSNAFTNITFTPDGTRVVFLSDLTNAAENQLWSVNVDGTSLTSLSPVPKLHGAIGTLTISTDSTRLAYTATRLDSPNLHVWSVPLSGGPPTNLSGTGDSSGNAWEIAISPDGQTVAYGAYATPSLIRKIWSVPASGGQPVLVSPDNLGNTYHSLCGFTGNSTRILFLGGGSPAFPSIAAQLYSSARTGLDTSILFTPTTSNGQSDCPARFGTHKPSVTPFDDLAVEFRGCSGSRCDIYRIAPAGGPLTNLTPSLPIGWSVVGGSMRRSGANLITPAFNTTTSESAVWATDRTTGSAQKISEIRNPFGSGDIFFPTSEVAGRIIFYSNHGDVSRKDLWVVDDRASSARLLTGSLPVGATGVPGGVAISFVVTTYLTSPDGKHILFTADKEAPNVFSWWSAPLSRHLLNLDDVELPTIHSASTDGITLLRYLFGVRGDALNSGNLSSIRSGNEISALLQANKALLDVDGDGEAYAMSDGLMIVRRMIGLPDAAVTFGAKATSRSDAQIREAIDLLLQ